jgi:hypothetical protein
MTRALLRLAALLALAPAAARAQAGTLSGQVVDADGRPLRAATVEVLGFDGKRTLSDTAGFFRIADLPVVPLTVRVRRIGFEGVDFDIRLIADSTVNVGVKLLPLTTTLDTVTTTAGPEARFRGLAQAGFFDRQRSGWGSYLDPEETARRRNLFLQPSRMLQDQNAIRLRPARGGNHVMGRAPNGDQCLMNVVKDGVHILRTNERAPASIDELVGLNEIGAIEIYPRATTTPSQFRTPSSDLCGTIVIWTVGRIR